MRSVLFGFATYEPGQVTVVGVGMQLVTVDNLGSSFDIGAITPGKIEVAGSGLPLLDPLVPAPGLEYVSGGGSAANLVDVSATLIGQTPYALHYRMTAAWTQGGSARTRLRISGVDAAGLFGVSFGGLRNDNNVAADGVASLGADLIFQNVAGVNMVNPLTITVYFSLAG